ncbi:MAG: isoprenylcysteine carboxylmethyltransferase family protein [Chlorobi bacterium]|nr:isoprenylcysteine carboxylmethyltransferase family protein [Chlorobiota bacterium]
MNINIVLYASILFFLSEFLLMVAKRSKKKRIKARNDKRSLILFWVVIPLSITAGFYLANYHEWSLVHLIIACCGLMVFLSGFIIRWFSIIQLNKQFTVDVVIRDDHKLNTKGLYTYIRHPSYLGLLLIILGLSLAMNSFFSLLVVVIPILLVLLYRIRIEEEILMNEFGDQYKTYMKNTSRIIPWLW